MVREVNFVIGTVDSAFTSSASTFNFTISKQMQKGDGTYYSLTDDITSSLITQFDCEIEDKSSNKVELLRINGLTSNGTTSDGRPKYIATIETNGATKLRGLANTYNGTNSTSNVISANIITTVTANSKVKLTVNRGSFQRAEDDFVSTTAVDTTLIANGAVNAGKVVDIDSTGKVVQGVNSGKYYGVSSTTVADGGAPTIYLAGNIITGITVPGNIGDYVYAESDGDLSATSTGNTLVGEKRSSTSMFILTPTNNPTLSQAEVEDSASATAGMVTGQRLYQSFVKNTQNSPVIVNVTAREALVDCNPVCLISSLTFAQSQTDGIFVGDTSNNTKVSLAPIFANGTAITTLNLSLKKAGTPADNFQVRLETDDGTGKPTGTLVHANATASIAGGSVTTSYVDTTFTFTSFTPTINTRMHLVIQRSGAVSGTNYFIVGHSTGGSYNRTQGALHNGTSWSVNDNNLCYISCSGFYTDGVYKLLDSTGTFQDIAFFGFSTGTFSAGSTAQIAISGYKSGFSSLVAGGRYKIASGVPSRLLGSSEDSQIVLRAVSSTAGIILQDFRA